MTDKNNNSVKRNKKIFNKTEVPPAREMGDLS
jgi:hypothetical protein